MIWNRIKKFFIYKSIHHYNNKIFFKILQTSSSLKLKLPFPLNISVNDVISLIIFPKSSIVYTLCSNTSEYQSSDNGSSLDPFSYSWTLLINPKSLTSSITLFLILLHISRIVDNTSASFDDLNTIGLLIGFPILEKKSPIPVSKRCTCLGLTNTNWKSSRTMGFFRSTCSEIAKYIRKSIYLNTNIWLYWEDSYSFLKILTWE